VEHQFFNCKKWRRQRKKFYEEIAKLGLLKPRNKDKIDKNKLFNNPHTYNAILAFLDATEIGLRINNNEREEEETHNQDS
jgi:hypothetical protein